MSEYSPHLVTVCGDPPETEEETVIRDLLSTRSLYRPEGIQAPAGSWGDGEVRRGRVTAHRD